MSPSRRSSSESPTGAGPAFGSCDAAPVARERADGGGDADARCTRATVALTALATFAGESENARPWPGPPATATSALGARFTPTPSALSCSAVVLALPAISSRLPSPTSTCAVGREVAERVEVAALLLRGDERRRVAGLARHLLELGGQPGELLGLLVVVRASAAGRRTGSRASRLRNGVSRSVPRKPTRNRPAAAAPGERLDLVLARRRRVRAGARATRGAELRRAFERGPAGAPALVAEARAGLDDRLVVAAAQEDHVDRAAEDEQDGDGERGQPRPWRAAGSSHQLPSDSLMSGTVVMKFGGTSVADAERLKRAAARIVAKREAGNRVVAVLSARGKTTDFLIAEAQEISPNPDPREMDMLLSTGERQSCALCAMAINDLGHRAISLTGSQAGIVTDTSHTKARILDVRADRIRQGLDEDAIVLVAGFQGVSTAKDVTTLGRGGSDTTAVALAAAIGAEICEIYTDVAGVFSADPRIVPDARKLPVVSFEEMLEMSASGAGVLQLRSVEYARNHGVRIHCRSSFTDEPGTVVVGEEETVEQPLITAVTHSTEEARVTIKGVPDTPGIAGRIATALAVANVNIDMIIQNEPVSEGAVADMSFTVPRSDLRRRAHRAGAARRGARPGDPDRRVDGQGVGHRRRHEVPPGRRGEGLHDARRRGREHRDDLDVADQDLLRHRRRRRARRRARAARRVRAVGRGHDPRRAAVRGVRMSAAAVGGLRVAVVGATGAVGTVMLRLLRDARASRRRRSSPFASERSVGRELDGGLVVAAARRRDDPGLRRRAVLGRRDALARVGASASSTPARSSSTTRARSGWSTRCRWSSPRSTPRRSTATTGSSPTRTARRWSRCCR